MASEPTTSKSVSAEDVARACAASFIANYERDVECELSEPNIAAHIVPHIAPIIAERDRLAAELAATQQGTCDAPQ